MLDWTEYDDAAKWCAKRNLKTAERLPEMLSVEVYAEICENPEAFAQRIKEIAYQLAMEAK